MLYQSNLCRAADNTSNYSNIFPAVAELTKFKKKSSIKAVLLLWKKKFIQSSLIIHQASIFLWFIKKKVNFLLTVSELLLFMFDMSTIYECTFRYHNHKNSKVMVNFPSSKTNIYTKTQNHSILYKLRWVFPQNFVYFQWKE